MEGTKAKKFSNPPTVEEEFVEKIPQEGPSNLEIAKQVVDVPFCPGYFSF